MIAARAVNALPFLFGATQSFAGVFASMAVVLRAVHRHYRCPRCNRLPMAGGFQSGFAGIAYRRGLLLNPASCPACGAPLV